DIVVTCHCALPPVSVTVTSLTGPVAGARVLFHTAAGTQYADVTTDATGRVVHAVTSGDSVTVVRAGSSGVHAASVLAVAPGESLLFTDYPYDDLTLTGQAAVTLSGPYVGATRYELYTGCREGSALNVAPGQGYGVVLGCRGPTTLVALARDANGTAIAWS